LKLTIKYLLALFENLNANDFVATFYFLLRYKIDLASQNIKSCIANGDAIPLIGNH